MDLLSQIIKEMDDKDILDIFSIPYLLWKTEEGMRLKELSQLFLSSKDTVSLFVIELREKLPGLIKQYFTSTYDSRKAIIEIRPGQGGLDAKDWARMLFETYSAFLKKKGILIDILDYEPDTVGITHCLFEVPSPFAYALFKNEFGLHRLERKSPFNTKGKLQTSHATMRILPYIKDSDQININPSDLEIKSTKSSGPGGQNVNKIETTIVIKHLPTGIIVRCSQTRSQHQNKQLALQILQSELLLKQKIENEKQKASFKNEYEETIRTYDFDMKQVKDHRTGTKFTNLDQIMKGNLNKVLLISVLSQLAVDPTP